MCAGLILTGVVGLQKGGLAQSLYKDGVDLDISLNVEKYTLSNGLTVLLHEDRRLPQVYHQIWMRVGSRDEEKGKTGLAHLFEHMMFRGTKHYPGKAYDEKQEQLGAANNAFTSHDYTAYYVTLPSRHLKTILEMEAGRFKDLQITQKGFEKEREVVKEERRQSTDNNPNDFFEPLMKLAFPVHPYGRPVIGSMQDLDRETIEDLNHFYNRFYNPSHAILVLAGDFKTEQAKKWIQKYYGSLPPAPVVSSPEIKSPAARPPRLRARKLRYKRNIQAPTLAVAYRGPKAAHPGAYALTVLNHVLTEGESARLYQLLVHEKKLALSVGGFYYDLKEEGLFILYALLAPGASLEEVKKLIEGEVVKTMHTKITETELLKSKRQIMFDYVEDIKSIAGKANALGEKEVMFGDYREFFKDLDRYRLVKAEDIQDQARGVLSPHRSVTVELVPF